MKLSRLPTKWFIGAAALMCAANATAQSQITRVDSTPAPPPAQAAPTTVSSPSPSETTTTSPVLDTGPSPFAVRDLPSTERAFPINRPLLITGTLVLGATWGTSIGFAYGSNRAEDQKYLYYPVAGPWLDLANRDCNARPCTSEDVNKALLIADGVGQGLAALAIVTSLFIPEGTTRHWYMLGSEKSVVGTPMRVGTGYGLGAVGRF